MLRIACTFAVCGALAIPATAGAATFGADLNEPAGPNGTCGTPCFVFASSVTANYYAPFSGIVNTVRIRTADVPQGDGRVQIVVMRSYFQNNPNSPGHPNFFCCFVQEYGPTVTLQRGVVNQFTNLSIGMVEQPTPAAGDFNTVAADDFLGLNLSGTTPGPLGQDAGGFVDVDDPATEPAPGANPHGAFRTRIAGANLMLSADIDPVGAGGGGGGGGAGGGGGGGNAPAAAPAPAPPITALPPAQPVTLGGPGRVLGGTATLPVTCALDTTCAGLMQLLGQARGAKAKRPAVYGSGRFSVPAHQAGTAKVKLNAAGRRLLKKWSSVRVVAKVTVGGQTTTSTVALRRAKRRR